MEQKKKLFISKEQLLEFWNEFESTTNKYNIPCKKGCVACCKQYVSLFSFEVVHFRDAIKKLPTKIKKKIQKNYTEYLPYFLENVPQKKSFRYDDLFVEGQNYSKKHAIDRYPCPFLIDQRCVIYNNRPIVCRLHFVLDEPELCELIPLRNAAKESINIQVRFTEFLCALGRCHLVPMIFVLRDLFDKKQKLPNIVYKNE